MASNDKPIYNAAIEALREDGKIAISMKALGELTDNIVSRQEKIHALEAETASLRAALLAVAAAWNDTQNGFAEADDMLDAACKAAAEAVRKGVEDGSTYDEF